MGELNEQQRLFDSEYPVNADYSEKVTFVAGHLGGFTIKQELFCHEYPACDFNATEAGINAGYSEKTAFMMAHENLRKPKIQKRIAEIVNKITDKADLTVQKVIDELMKIAFFDPQKLYDEDGAAIEFHKLPADVAAAMDITVTYNKDGSKTYKSKKVNNIDKKGALDLLGKYLKMFVERHEVEIPGLIIRLPAKKPLGAPVNESKAEE